MAPGAKPKKAKERGDLCMRCPDDQTLVVHRHGFNLAECLKETPPGTKDMWWMFPKGSSIDELDFSQPQTCKDVLLKARIAMEGIPGKPNKMAKTTVTLKMDLRRHNGTTTNELITKGILDQAIAGIPRADYAEVEAAHEAAAERVKTQATSGAALVGPSSSSKDEGGSSDGAVVSLPLRTKDSGDDVDDPTELDDITQEIDRVPQHRTSESHLKESLELSLRAPTSVSNVNVPQKPDLMIRQNLAKPRELSYPANKTFPARKSYQKIPTPVQVLVNHFRIRLPPKLELYEYSISSLSDDFNNATRNKRKVLIRDLIDTHRLLKTQLHTIASDYHSKIIAGENLLKGYKGKSFSGAVNSYRRGTFDAPTTVDMTVTQTAVHNIDELMDFVDGKNPGYEEVGAAEAMNIMFAKAVMQDSDNAFHAGGNRFYYRPGWSELVQSGSNNRKLTPDQVGLIAMRGYSCKVRPGMQAVTLNINTLTGAFYRPQSVQDYLKQIGPPTGKWTQGQLQDANRHLAGLRAYVNFERFKPGTDQDNSIDSPKRRTKIINDFQKEAIDLKFDPRPTGQQEEKAKAGTVAGRPGSTSRHGPTQTKSKDTITVWNHLSIEYPGIDLGTRDQISVNVGGKGDNHKFYLPHLLKILGDQMYRRKITGDTVSAMIKCARRTPDQNRRAILGEGLPSLQLDNEKVPPPMLKKLGISIVPHMMSIPAREIGTPEVRYKSLQNPAVKEHTHHIKPSPDRPRWTNENLVFIDTFEKFSKVKPNPTFQFYHYGDNSPQGLLQAIRANFEKYHHVHGLQKLYPASGEAFIRLEKSHTDFKALAARLREVKPEPSLHILVLPQKDAHCAEMHAIFKSVAEQELGVASAVFCVQSMKGSVTDKKDINNDNLAAYFGNYAMKLNLRLGNTNHIVHPASFKPIQNPEQQLSCMIMGADVTHPGSGSVQGTKSIAAVVGSVDKNFCVFPGSMRLQEPRKEIITDMEAMVEECLERYYDRNDKRMPARILFYRDGVSESQYDAVLQSEVEKIYLAHHAVWTKFNPGKPESDWKRPLVTALIVAKRHHTRFFPTQSQPSCKAGTVIDSGITSPYFHDFFLQSHAGGVGTPKPAHYFVLRNDIEIADQQLQDVTNALCYAYGRSTSPVSYAPPAYYADRLCDRGRQYLKPWFDGKPELKALIATEVGDRIKADWKRNASRANPWHENMDNTMFWM